MAIEVNAPEVLGAVQLGIIDKNEARSILFGLPAVTEENK